MEVTPNTLREVVFREKLRGGYHPDDVDEFLEQVASGVEVLHDRLHQAVDRAQRAEAAATSSTSSPDHAGEGAEESVRTLVLAQRTADMTILEAREQAARILADAEQQAQSVITSAEERARRHEEATLSNTRSDLTKMEATRAQAQQEVEALSRWIEEHKAHLASTLRDALSVVERSGAKSSPPTSHPIEGVHREPPVTSSAAAAAQAEPAAAESGHAPEDEQSEAAEDADAAQPVEADPTVVSPWAERSAERATFNAEGVNNVSANAPAPATSGGGGGDPIDPAEQALDEFFDDPEFVDDDRRFGGRLRRRR